MPVRRRRQRRPVCEEIGLQIAPMIDITLLLLFFFMLSDGADRASARREIRLPEAAPEQPSDPESDAQSFILDVDAAGVWFAGEHRVDASQLRALLRNKRTLLIRADAHTPVATIQRIAHTAAEAGIHTLKHRIQTP